MPEILTAENLQGLSGIRHGFYTSAWGNCGLADHYDQAEVLANRARVAESLSVAPENLLSCYQIHSPDVVTMTKPWAVADRPKADALVTREKGIALGILTADCVPLLFADPKAGIIGAAHAGWRGAIGGVIENTIKAMEELGARKSSIIAALGPCIAQKSYEVGPEFPVPFLAENPANEIFFRPAFKDEPYQLIATQGMDGFDSEARRLPASDKYMFDLPGYVMAKLRALGVVSVEPPPADTCADEARFFSYRRGCLQGRERDGSLISVIVLSG